MMNALLTMWDFLWEWLLSPEEGVLGSYWPAGLVCSPLVLTEVEDDSVDLERDIAWPTDELSIN